MTPSGRVFVAALVIVGAFALAIAGVVTRAEGAITAAVGLAGPVLGYTFGDANGEKRTARALTVMGAEGAVASMVDEHLTAVADAGAEIDVTHDAKERRP